MLKENALVKVSYQKVEHRGNQVIHGETTHRVIIPTFVPAPKNLNVKAIDVTDLSEDERNCLLDAWTEYQEYLENKQKTLFAFDDFVEHTGRDVPDIKWRTFKPNQLHEDK